MADNADELRARLRKEVKSLVLSESDLQQLRAMATDGRLYELGFRWMQFRNGDPADWEMIPAENGEWCILFDRSMSKDASIAGALDAVLTRLKDEPGRTHWLLGVVQHARQKHPAQTNEEALINLADQNQWPIWAIWSLPRLVLERSDGRCLVWHGAARIVMPPATLVRCEGLCGGQVRVLEQRPANDVWNDLCGIDSWRHYADIKGATRTISRIVAHSSGARSIAAMLELSREGAIQMEIEYEREVPLVSKAQFVIRRRGDLWGHAISLAEERIAAAIDAVAISDADRNPDPMATADQMLNMVG